MARYFIFLPITCSELHQGVTLKMKVGVIRGRTRDMIILSFISESSHAASCGFFRERHRRFPIFRNLPPSKEILFTTKNGTENDSHGSCYQARLALWGWTHAQRFKYSKRTLCHLTVIPRTTKCVTSLCNLLLLLPLLLTHILLNFEIGSNQ